MFGKLTLEAIPFHEPIVMVTLAVVAVLGAAVFAAITYYKKWGYLWKEWFTSVDHKKIGVMYIAVAIIMLIRGFADAIMMRTQQAVAVAGSTGYLPPEHYDQVFTAHGTIMIIFMAMPFMIGLMNIVVPLQIGARDVAFPFLNSVSFWFFVVGALLVNISLGIGEFGKTGWTAYPPLSGIQYSPGVGVDYYIWALQISGLGTLLTGVNFIVTILKMRAPGMTLMKMPVFTWNCLCTAILIAASFPILTATMFLLSLDRYLGMHFFTNELGGNPMMYVNLFWAWGHPEVYILILPAFGVFSEVTSTFAKKRLFGYVSLVWATIAITVLSFIVWLHHFFTMGAGSNVNAFFGIMTMIIAVPTGVKIFTWLFTMYRGRIEFKTPMLWTVGFIVTFSIGGMTGVLLAVPGADFVLHNSLFLIAHFHNVIIGGAVFGYLAGFTFWFPKAFGFKLNERLGKCSFWCWLIGFYFAFMPLYALGFMGMTRRLNHTDNPEWTPWFYVAMVGVLFIAAGIGFQLLQIFVSIRDRKKNLDVSGDPWDGRTLEWSTSSPPPFYNFAEVPAVSDLDAYWGMKERGEATANTADYKQIHMPRNTGMGFIIAAFSLVFGFAFVWHIWWAVAVGFVGMIVTLIVRSYDDDIDYYVPAAEVARIEGERQRALANANAGVTSGTRVTSTLEKV
jgi:cytochrome o ubiquinol oxidase subunit 1